MQIAIQLTILLVPFVVQQIFYLRYVTERAQAPSLASRLTNHLWDGLYFGLMIVALIQLGRGGWNGQRWIGYGLLWAGSLLRIGALRELRSLYTVYIMVLNDHQVISSGPYRYLRHPLTLGTLLEIIGFALFLPLWLALAFGLGSYALMVLHNRREEQVLVRHLGSAYQHYMARTWDVIDLVPFGKARVN